MDGKIAECLRSLRSGIQETEDNPHATSPHDRAAEYHNKAAHAHEAPPSPTAKATILRPTNFSRQAHEYSIKAFEHSKEAAAKFKAGKLGPRPVAQ